MNKLLVSTGLAPGMSVWPSSPLAVIVGMAMTVLAINSKVGLTWTPPIGAALLPGAACVLISSYAQVRGARVLAEAAYYIGLWLAWPLLSVQLTYLAARADFPLCDRALIDADALLGFHWSDWVRFVDYRPWLSTASGWVYSSTFAQTLVTVLVLAWLGPKGRNNELFVHMSIAFLITLAAFTISPSLGPAFFTEFGPTIQEVILTRLRSGDTGPYIYSGIVSFPSFHTVIAVLFVYAHRDRTPLFVLFMIVNAAMLMSIPYSGAHYLVNLGGGALISIATIALARAIRSRARDPQSQ